MQVNSRTANSIRNARVALLFSVVLLFLGYFSRRYFIECLGTELLGLSTTINNILGFINLAELGIGTVVTYALYKPLKNQERYEINEIIAINELYYIKIVRIILVISAILCGLFPLFFSEITFPLWYVYATFGVLLLSLLLNNYLNYKQVLLIANQQEYKVTLSTQSVRTIKIIIQIIGIGLLNFGYEFWLITELFSAIIIGIVLKLVINHSYPQISFNHLNKKEITQKHPEILSKAKQLFFHRASEFVRQQANPIIIYTFLSLSVVAIFGNYMMLVMDLIVLTNSIFNGATASIGNLIAEGDKHKIVSFYFKFSAIRLLFTSTLCFCFHTLSNDFISVWIGESYIIDKTTFTLLTIFSFLSLARINDQFIAAYGLFQDVWAAITEIVLNIGLSVFLGYLFGLSGIVVGGICSTFLIAYCWKPYFLFKYGFGIRISKFLKFVLKIGIVIIATWTLGFFLIKTISKTTTTIFDWGIFAFIVLICFSLISFILFKLIKNKLLDI